MKRVTLIVALVCAVGYAAIAAETPAQDAGKKGEVVRAAAFGFDAADATKALQAAIDSGARKVIVEKMASPWVVEPIRLAGDQELALEAGAVIQAKRGAFTSPGECLLSAAGKRNVTISGGPGAALRMWRADYDRAPYKKSEHRHAISIKSCAGVRISGLTIAESGGDGIYLGVAGRETNRDVVIRDVVCDRNYRQGISVISAENLLIENTVLRDTSGTAPMAGIDFEPNNPSEKLVNCVMRNCVAENNAGDGFTFYVKHQDARSAPLSIRLENCRSVGNRFGFRFASGGDESSAPAPGVVEVTGCRFEKSADGGIAVNGNLAGGRRIRFEKCEVANAALEKPRSAPIQISSITGNPNNVGGVEFAECVVVDPVERRPMAYTDLAGGLRLKDVGGSLAVERAGRRTVYALDEKLLGEWFPSQAFKDFPAFRLAGAQWRPAAPEARPERGWSCPVRQRGHAEWLVWAEAGEEVSLTLGLSRVGRAGVPRTPVSVVDPGGKARKVAELAKEGEAVCKFTAGARGAYRVICEPGRSAARVVASSHRVCIVTERAPIHVLGAAGTLYFYVPAGVDEFAVRVGAGGEGESVKATVYDAAGKKVGEQDNILAQQFVCTRGKGAGAEVWRVRLEKPSRGGIEDNYVMLQGIAPLLASSPQGLIANEE